ncbi:MAG: NAD(P)/FAD-dependent oxidoreductase [Oscillospiraceae bacterium]|jgi:predicted Rossmann fold flavoprotein|nr:NAD(P)/FAD-dependent oxidoreductase [Oscillospiraceae bacterium]
MKNIDRAPELRRVAVAGAGPAGLMAAGMAAARGHSVTLFDPNGFPGKKLRITGKGRCNLTNNAPVDECLRNIPQNAKFLHSSLTRFSPFDVMDFFESISLPLKTERGNRVFPVSDRAGDVVSALEGWLSGLGVNVTPGRVTGLDIRDGVLQGVRTDRGAHPCDRLVVATGGVSYPGTGSTGDGYRLAALAGHTVSPPVPSLVPLLSDDPCCAAMQGLSLRNVALAVYNGAGKPVYTDFGEMLFTHFGLSGPIILSASAHMRPPQSRWRLSVDLKPALDPDKLDARLLRDFLQFRNRDFQNALADLLHKKMIPVIIEKSGIDPAKKVHSITQAERARLLALLKGFPVSVSGLGPIEDAVVTSGGVSVGELDPKTMASRLVSGLFFAGEVIDADAYTGGFNLQIAWSTGHAAGMAV